MGLNKTTRKALYLGESRQIKKKKKKSQAGKGVNQCPGRIICKKLMELLTRDGSLHILGPMQEALQKGSGKKKRERQRPERDRERERNSLTSAAALTSRFTKVQPASPYSLPRIHLLTTIPHLLPKENKKQKMT